MGWGWEVEKRHLTPLYISRQSSRAAAARLAAKVSCSVFGLPRMFRSTRADLPLSTIVKLHILPVHSPNLHMYVSASMEVAYSDRTRRAARAQAQLARLDVHQSFVRSSDMSLPRARNRRRSACKLSAILHQLSVISSFKAHKVKRTYQTIHGGFESRPMHPSIIGYTHGKRDDLGRGVCMFPLSTSRFPITWIEEQRWRGSRIGSGPATQFVASEPASAFLGVSSLWSDQLSSMPLRRDQPVADETLLATLPSQASRA